MIEMANILATLASKRPVFSNEADLRNALADHIQATTAHAQVWKKHKPFQLEEKPFQKEFVDLWVETPDGAAFRIHEGSVLSGILAWKDHASAGTTQGREKPHVLTSTYRPAWHDYSSLLGDNGRFRYVLVRVA